MKSVLLSVRPQHVVNILNGLKTIEVRKRFPSDYVGWVYIYCCKQRKNEIGCHINYEKVDGKVVARFWCDKVKTFRCNVTGNLKDGFFKAEPYCKEIGDGTARYNCDDEFESTLKNAQITNKELAQYLGDKEYPYGGHYVFNAIHITKLEIFYKSKEISEFYKVGYENSVIATTKYILCSMNREERRKYKTELDLKINNEIAVIKDIYKLTRAPQSWSYCEVDL